MAENTLASIEAGIGLGADMIEFDVQSCEHELVVIHDPRLERTTNGQGRVASVSLSYLRGLDAGQGHQIPTLQEVLDTVAGRVPLNVEIKSADGTAANVAKVLQRALESNRWRPEQFLVSSFHHPELAIFKQRMPTVPVAALICGVPLDGAACAVNLGAQALNISAEFADPYLVEDAHRHGLKVYAYTVNHVDDALALRTIGLDGVFSDFPDRILAALRPTDG